MSDATIVYPYAPAEVAEVALRLLDAADLGIRQRPADQNDPVYSALLARAKARALHEAACSLGMNPLSVPGTWACATCGAFHAGVGDICSTCAAAEDRMDD